jgi:hypothetical protein
MVLRFIMLVNVSQFIPYYYYAIVWIYHLLQLIDV